MPSTLAAISRDPQAEFTIEPVHIDEPRGQEILVRIVAAGICHTDLVSRGIGAADRPILLGHEGAGIVAAVGPDVYDVRQGDHVVLTYRHCGDCRNCRLGRLSYCAHATRLNQFGPRQDGTPRVMIGDTVVRDGFFGQSSFAGYALASVDNTVVVPPWTDLEVAAPLGCGFQTGAGAVLEVLRPEPGSHLVIFGAGAVGMAALLAARTLDDTAVIVVETSPHRRAFATELGAAHVLDPAEGDTVAEIWARTETGATHALDTTGKPEVLAAAVAALAVGGTVAAVGLGTGVPPIDLRDIVLAGKTIRGCLEGDAEPRRFIPELLRLHAAGYLPLERLVRAYPYTDINTALAAAAAGRIIKPVLRW
ncbi:NAD(P)-dependent alcohol dehydrogenase [Nocardia sp. 004]|uniref:NAD(P)-dependent alcohol dehydrogenase n=1 Tax=Nocardia sp. 004 TaxID=3385978 RepID=UPI0039A2ADA0